MNTERWRGYWRSMRVWFKSGADFLISRNIWDKLRKKISDTYEQLKKYNQTLYIKYKKAIIVVKSKIIAIGKSLEAWRLQKPPYKKLISVGLLAALCYGSMFAYNKAEAYKIANTPIAAVEVLFKGESIGVVASEEPLQQAIEDMERQIEDYYKMDVVSVDDIVFSPTAVKPALIENNDAILNVIKDGMHFKVKATAILVNGQQIAVVKDESEAQTVLDRIKQPYIDKAKDNPNIKEVRIADDVQLVEKLVEYSDIENADDVYKRIKDGDEGKKVYEVKDGDTIWAIAKRYKLSLDDIQKANPDITSLDDLQIGDKINLTVPKEIINVETVERIEYTEDIPYETVYKEDGKLYKNQSKVLTEGSNGQREIVADVIKINGVEQKRTIISDNVVKNKRDQVIAKGTKPLPSIIGTGNIGLPARGRITSRFGYRGKEFHAGVDIAAPYGSPIHAADNGKVIFAGWNGNYGNLVKIDHGNGMVTYYAHASRIAVKVGQAVAKGQLIAYVGSTGRSTGPHVHFEVRKNGKPINPMR